MKKSNIAIGVLLLGLCTFVFLYGGLTFPAASGTDAGTKFFPLILAGIMAVLAVILIIQGILERSGETGGFSFPIRSPEMMRVAAALLLCILFAILVKPVGFIVMGAVLLFCMMRLLGCKKYWLIALISVSVVVIVQLFFEKVLSVMLPYGILTHIIYG